MKNAPAAVSKKKPYVKKKYNFDFMQRCPCSCANTFIVLAFKISLIVTIYGHLAGNVNFFNQL